MYETISAYIDFAGNCDDRGWLLNIKCIFNAEDFDIEEVMVVNKLGNAHELNLDWEKKAHKSLCDAIDASVLDKFETREVLSGRY